ncbi:BolA/IbaG family iron-sulfur metabolism protein [Nocardia sp. NPDC046473]|uniref:BolA/IbaG family iron-sulfur metabolism protein n=1 Tax=Nocardia sp. NPDC046473 TaxID=3155733 RepID=UPI003403AF33
MTASEAAAELRARLIVQELRVLGSKGRFSVYVVGELFTGMSRVQRQLAVQTALAEPIADGRVLGLSVEAYSPCERPQHT